MQEESPTERLREPLACQPNMHGDASGIRRLAAPDISITIDDSMQVRARRGETVATALLAFSTSAIQLYCGMGVCHVCTIEIDGQKRRACVEKVEDGMRIRLNQAQADA
jgi:predicted molibdopterin-dependent oxidoreductase YjgC